MDWRVTVYSMSSGGGASVGVTVYSIKKRLVARQRSLVVIIVIIMSVGDCAVGKDGMYTVKPGRVRVILSRHGETRSSHTSHHHQHNWNISNNKQYTNSSLSSHLD